MKSALSNQSEGVLGDSPADYIHQVNSLGVIRYLNLLIIACQQYRGAGVALLGGDNAFFDRINLLHKQIEWHMRHITALNEQYHYVINRDDWGRIVSQWKELKTTSDSCSVLEYFDLHSQFIGRLIGLIWSISMDAHYYLKVPKESRSQKTYIDGQNREHHILIEVTMRLMPSLVEIIARIRGMSTHVAVLRACDTEHLAILTRLLQQLNAERDKLTSSTRSLSYDTLIRMPVLAEILLYDHKLDQLQQILKRDVMKSGEVALESQSLFDFSTSVIDVYCKVMEEGIHYFQVVLDNMLSVDKLFSDSYIDNNNHFNHSMSVG